MSRMTLVHGAQRGACCWERVAAELRAQNHDAVAVELPGHSDGKTPLAAAPHPGYRDRVATSNSASKRDGRAGRSPHGTARSVMIQN